MAAYPLPDNDNPILPVYMADASSAIEIIVLRSQSIDWENHTSADIPISVQPNSEGKFPLNRNNFTVPKAHVSIGTIQIRVLADAQLGEYTFTRGTTLGGGKIIVQANP